MLQRAWRKGASEEIEVIVSFQPGEKYLGVALNHYHTDLLVIHGPVAAPISNYYAMERGARVIGQTQ